MQLNDFDGFEAVWQRVTAPACPLPTVGRPAPMGDTAQIEGLIRHEAALEAAYLALLRRWQQGSCRAVFARGAKLAAGGHSRLQAVYYLAAGDSFAPERTGRINCDLPEALRTLWFLERSTAAAWQQLGAGPGMADGLSWPPMAKLHGRQAAELFGLLECMMR